MTRTAVSLMVLGLTAPALAQGLPALEGQGTQSQGVELAKGAVSVSIDSTGDLSLGRGEDTLGGGIGITVNGVTVGIGQQAGEESTPTRPGAQMPLPVAASAATPLSPGMAGTAQTAAPMLPACPEPLPGPDALASVMERGGRLFLETAQCSHPAADVARLLAAFPALTQRLEGQLNAGETVVAITIDNATVILGRASASINR